MSFARAMNRWRWREGRDGGGRAELEARAASRLLDEALSVFGFLQASVHDDKGALDAEIQELLTRAAHDVLDDVASLGGLVLGGSGWRSWPREVLRRRSTASVPTARRAVDDLARYTARLAATAMAFENQETDGAREFGRLAAAAEARLAQLAA